MRSCEEFKSHCKKPLDRAVEENTCYRLKVEFATKSLDD